MKLQEIFDSLTTGEFSQLNIGGAGQGVIDETNYSRVLPHINLGLTSLYRRFPLKNGRLTLELQPDLLRYRLTSAYAVAARRSQQPVRYIRDSAAEPFTDDVLKVERVIADLEGELPINDGAHPLSVITPSLLVLELPEGLQSETVDVLYRANHAPVVQGLGYFDPTRVELELPASHQEALLYFVAARAHSPLGMANEGQGGNQFYALYEGACAELEAKNLQIDQVDTNTRLRRGGWV